MSKKRFPYCLPPILGVVLITLNGLFGQNGVAQDKSPAAEKSLLDGAYFGESKDQYGRRAWLLRINAKGSSGLLYMPPGLRSIGEISLTSSGQLTFRTEGTIGDLIYGFSGQISSGVVRGKILTERKRRTGSEKLNEVEVEFRKVDIANAVKHPIARVYSNMMFHEESGDLVGGELILIPGEKEIIGLFTPDDGGLTPYAIYDVQYSDKDKRLVFEIEKISGKERYSGVVSARSVKLKRSDPDAAPDADPLILPKRKSLIGIFSK